MSAPEKVVISKSINKLAVISGCQIYRGVVFAVFVHKPVDTAMLFVAQISFVSVSFSGFKSSRCGIVLHDKIIPIYDPYISIGANFSNDW